MYGYVYVFDRVNVCMYACSICVYVYMYVFLYVRICIYTHTHIYKMCFVCLYTYVYVHVYVYTYKVCILYVYTSVHMYIYIQNISTCTHMYVNCTLLQAQVPECIKLSETISVSLPLVPLQAVYAVMTVALVAGPGCLCLDWIYFEVMFITAWDLL